MSNIFTANCVILETQAIIIYSQVIML